MDIIEFQQKAEEFVDEVVLTGQPIQFEREGRAAAVLVSYEKYQHILEGWETLEIAWSTEAYNLLLALAIQLETTVPNVIRDALTSKLEEVRGIPEELPHERP